MAGIDRRISGGIARETANAASGQVNRRDQKRAEASSSTFSPSSRLSARDLAIVTFVSRFRMASASQIGRIFFADGSERSRGVRKRRTLRRLVRWGELGRLPRPVGGGMGGSGEYTYLMPGSRSRVPDPHTLDITELYVQLKEVERGAFGPPSALLAFDPEPFSHVYLGHIELKPDAYCRIRTSSGTRRFFIEVDRSTEWRTQLHKKLRRYVAAYHAWKEAVFPQVIFIVPDSQRQRLVESVVRRQEVPQLFKVVLFDETITYLSG